MVTRTDPIEQAHAQAERLLPAAAGPRGGFGRLHGLIEIADGFDAPLDDFACMMYATDAPRPEPSR